MYGIHGPVRRIFIKPSLVMKPVFIIYQRGFAEGGRGVEEWVISGPNAGKGENTAADFSDRAGGGSAFDCMWGGDVAADERKQERWGIVSSFRRFI